MSMGLADLRLARESAEDAARRIVPGRAEWRPLSTLAAFRDEWRDLCVRALEPNVFYEPAFALAAAPAFGRDAGAVLVWSKASSRLIGLFPARIERRYGVMTTLTGWTHPYAPLGTPLVDRDEAEGAIVAFLDHVEMNGRLPNLVMLPLLAREGAFVATLMRVLARHNGTTAQFGTHARAMLAPNGERLTYLDHAMSRKRLKELRRQRRRLLEAGQLKFVTARDADAIPRALADFVALEAHGWKGRAGSAVAGHADVRTFMQGAVGALAAHGQARVDRLMQNGRALAAAITLTSGDTAWFWKIAYAEDVARASPGVQVTLDVTEALLAEPSVLRADSCATAGHPMIDHLWRERLTIADLLVAPSAAALKQFSFARRLETMRRALISGAKTLRNGRR